MQTFTNPSSAYTAVLRQLLGDPDCFSAPRGIGVAEMLDYSFRVDNPSARSIVTADPNRNAVLARYLEVEFGLYASGDASAATFTKGAKFWADLANPDGTINSAYGKLLFYDHTYHSRFNWHALTPWEWCYDKLREDPDTRQAVLLFARPDHFWNGNKDVVCTLSGQFILRAGLLNFCVNMRSNDVYRGLPYDMPWFCYLQQRMAAAIGAEVGWYSHRAGSMHMYDRDRQACERMVDGWTERVLDAG